MYGFVWLCRAVCGCVWLCRAMYGSVGLCMAVNHIFESFNTIYLLKRLKTICNLKDKILRNGEDCFCTSHFFNNSSKSNTTLRGLLFSLFFVTHLTASACRSSVPIYGVHLRTKITENKIQFEVQKLDYPFRNLVI